MKDFVFFFSAAITELSLNEKIQSQEMLFKAGYRQRMPNGLSNEMSS